MNRACVKVLGLSIALAAFAGTAGAEEWGRINDGQPIQIEREPNGLTEPNPEGPHAFDVDQIVGIEPENKTPEDVAKEKKTAKQRSYREEKRRED